MGKRFQEVPPGIVVSPAPASEIHEPTIKGVEELGFLYPETALAKGKRKFQVSPAPASQVHEPTFVGVEEV